MSRYALRPSRCALSVVISGSYLLGMWIGSGLAQVPTAITPDGTMGTTVSQMGPVYDITGGTRPGNGPNLFHSFERFTVGTNDTARFSGPNGVENILSRVTGGQQSMIDGLLQSTIPGANLYLLNPSGVLFHPNARLDVGGSFHVSTADFLRFADGATFSAHLGERTTLTVAPPVAFGFLSVNPAPMTIAGSSLQVPAGEALTVVGGEVRIVGGQLVAPSGRVQIASVASPGEVRFTPLELAPDLQVDGFARLDRLELSQGAVVNASGGGTSGSGGPGGTVLIRSGSLLVDRSNVLANTLGEVHGASMGLDLRVIGDAVVMNASLLRSSPFAGGNGGSVVINAGTLTLANGSAIISNGFGSGRGGDLTVSATESISIAGRDNAGNTSAFFSNTFGRGDTGRLSISTPTLAMNGGIIQAAVDGRGSGNSNGITIEVGRLMMSDGAQIDSSTFGSGRGGELRVVATEAITISGQGSQEPQTGLFSVTNGSGDAGRLFVSAPTLDIAGGRILGRTLGGGHAGDIELRVGRLALTEGAQIFNGTGRAVSGGVIGIDGPGRGGELTVMATDSIVIVGHDQQGFPSGLFSSAQFGQGDAGNLFISTPVLILDGGGQIEAATLGSSQGDGGNIEVQVGRLTMSGGAQIGTSSFGSGRGGELRVVASEAISLTGQGSVAPQTGLFSVADESGDGGRLFVSAPLLESAGGRILGRTLGGGHAGDIELRVGRLALTEGAQIFNGTGNFVGGRPIGQVDGLGRGGNLTVVATDSIVIAGHDQLGLPSGLFSGAQIGRGDAGNIDVQVGRLMMSEGALISTSTRSGSSGRGGELRVVATEAISITGRGSLLPQTGLLSVTDGSGDAGRLFVSAPLLESAGGRILGRTLGGGHAGDIELRVGRLALTEGAQIFNGTGNFVGGRPIGQVDGLGRGGNLTVVATDSIVIAGHDQLGLPSGLFSSAQIGRGDAGNLFISTPTLTMMDSGLIAAETFSTSSGHAGNIEVRVGRLALSEGAQISTSSVGSGRGGNVDIAATEQIELNNGGTISSSSFGQGNAGNIVIQAGKLFRSRNGAVTTEADTADGGNITLTAGSLVELRDSEITATVRSGVGQGGNITIDPQSVVLQRSQIRADAFGGPGGNVSIVAEVFLADPASDVSASSALGIAGTVDIRAPVTNLSGLVTPLPPEFAQVAGLLRDRCAARLREGSVSSLVERGRDSVPASPEGILPSRLYSGTSSSTAATSATSLSQQGGGPPNHERHLQSRRQRVRSGATPVEVPACAAQ